MGEVKESQVEVLYNPVSLPNKEAAKIESTFEIGDQKHQENLRFLQEEESGEEANPENVLGKIDLSVSQNAIGKPPFVFISTCRLVPVKNLDRLINAFSKIVTRYPQSNFELWLVGDGPLKIMLENQTKNMYLNMKVSLKLCTSTDSVLVMSSAQIMKSNRWWIRVRVVFVGDI